MMRNPRTIYKHFVRLGAFLLEEVVIFHVSQLLLQDEVSFNCQLFLDKDLVWVMNLLLTYYMLDKDISTQE